MKQLRLELRGSIKGLDSFFNQTVMSHLLPDDTLEVNGFTWLIKHVNFYGEDEMSIRLIEDKP